MVYWLMTPMPWSPREHSANDMTLSKPQVARAWEMGRGERAIIDYLKAV